MTVKEKLKEIKGGALLSVGIKFNKVDFLEYTIENFDLIDKNILNKEIEKVVKFKDDPMYVEIVCK